MTSIPERFNLALDELLTHLEEEAAEVIQACTKMRRFGPGGADPRVANSPLNHQALATELGQLRLVVSAIQALDSMLLREADLAAGYESKREKLQRYLKHSVLTVHGHQVMTCLSSEQVGSPAEWKIGRCGRCGREAQRVVFVATHNPWVSYYLCAGGCIPKEGRSEDNSSPPTSTDSSPEPRAPKYCDQHGIALPCFTCVNASQLLGRCRACGAEVPKRDLQAGFCSGVCSRKPESP
jgi:NTP pyrophosphatase (non-canonical NTP hydrolase)